MTEQRDFSTTIGATDIAGILRVSQYATPMSVWLRLTGQAETAEPNAAMNRGTKLEPFVAQAFTEMTDYQIEKSPVLVHPRFSWLCASPDYQCVNVPYYVEIKTHRPYIRSQQYGDEYTDEVPEHIALQALWQAHMGRVTGQMDDCEGTFVCAAFGFDDIGIWRVPYDQGLCETVEQRIVEWYEKHIIGGVAPDPTGSAVDTAFLNRRWKPVEDVEIVAQGDLIDTVVALREEQAHLKAAERRVEELTNQIKAAMGEATVLRITQDHQITWRMAKGRATKTVNFDALKAAGLYDKYVTETVGEGSRRFVTPRSWAREEE